MIANATKTLSYLFANRTPIMIAELACTTVKKHKKEVNGLPFDEKMHKR